MTTEYAQVIEALIGGRSRGIGERLMSQYKTVQGVVQNIDSLPITVRQKAVLRSALELRCIAEKTASVSSPSDIAALCKHLEVETQEQLIVIGLNRANDVIFQEMVYKGSVYSAQVRVAEVFRIAIIRNACSIAVVHNHPSGDPAPSSDDVALTRSIVQAGKLLDIDVIDHVIIGFGKWQSLKERGLGF